MINSFFVGGEATQDLIRTILNIYLYGDDERPEYFGSHIRTDFESPIVTFNSQEFMSIGPGRFVQASMFSVVQRFFDGEFTDFIEQNDGDVSGIQLVNEFFGGNEAAFRPVSYTHLTLPTILLV